MKSFAWDDVQLLLALLRATNTEQAAMHLEVNRSTISRRLAGLEKSLGARLFTRNRDGLAPTAAALRLRPLAESMELAAAALAGAASNADDRVVGTVRVATTEALAASLVSDGLLTNDQHPDLVIELLAGNRPLDVLHGEADIALRISVVRAAALRVRCVARTGVGLFASHAYLRARGPVQSRGSLRGQNLLLPAGDLARLPESKWLLSRKGARIVFRSNSMTALVAAAVAGRGIVPLPLSWGQSIPELDQLLVLESIPKRPMWLVTKAEKPERSAVRFVSDRIAAILARRATRSG